MPEAFDAITLEIDFDAGSWTDVTEYLQLKPTPKWRRGIMSGKPTARTAQIGTFTFGLENVDGIFSPGHASAQPGFGVGNKLRLSFTKEGVPFYKFYGRIYKGGIKVLPGSLGQRRTLIVACDWMKVVSSHELRLLSMETSKRADEAVASIDANLAISPLATQYSTGEVTFPRIFHLTKDRTKALAEINNIMQSEFGQYYSIGDKSGGETVVFDSRHTKGSISENTTLSITGNESGRLLAEDGSYVLHEDGSKIILCEVQEAEFDNVYDDIEIVEGKHLANLIKARSRPVEIDATATTILFSLKEVIEIRGGATENIRCQYTDPTGADRKVTGTEQVTPVATTDYVANAQADGGGADLTGSLSVTASYGVEAVEYELENTGGTTLFITKLEARGKGIYDYQPVEYLLEDTDSQLIHGVVPLTIDFRYEPDPIIAKGYGELILLRTKDPVITVEKIKLIANFNSMCMYGFLQLEPGTRFGLKETHSALDSDYFVMGYSAEIIGGRVVKYTIVPLESSRTTIWILGTSALGQDTILEIG